ncbi:MAG TPA: hypothetical protein VFU22_28495, partial [Roseiflexaceae bacterium]|nr:hypothetical protein [Roseiflexaceae bacterium]
VEATALGNLMVQAVARGDLPDIAAGRAAVAASFEQAIYEPRPAGAWLAALTRFEQLIGAAQRSPGD